jgi:hypothetical protein
MSVRRTAGLLLSLALAPTAHADQFAHLELPQAQAALAHVHRGDVVHLYCAPCGEAHSQRMTVRSLGIDRVWDRRGSAKVYRDGDGAGYWVVEANDAMLDLAYVYVRDGRRWRNLATVLGLHPQGVPAELSRAATGTRWQCEGTDDNPYLAQDGRRDPCD